MLEYRTLLPKLFQTGRKNPRLTMKRSWPNILRAWATSGGPSLRTALSNGDPFLNKIEKGSVVNIAGTPRGFSNGAVMLDGRIIGAGNLMLVGGKALAGEELFRD